MGAARQDDPERTSVVRGAFKLRTAIVKLCDMFDNRKAEAGSSKRTAAFLVDTVKTFENAALMFRGNPDSIIPDLDHRKIVTMRQGKINRFRPAVLNGIVDQIDNGLLEKLAVSLDFNVFKFFYGKGHPVL